MRIFMTGLETGDAAGLRMFNGGYDAASLTETKQRSGDYGIDFLVDHVEGDNGWARHWIQGLGAVGGSGPTEIFVRAYMRIENTMDQGVEILRIKGGASSSYDILRFDLGGEVWAWYDAVWNDKGGMVSGMDNDDTYHCWEYYIRLNTSDIYLDGQVIIHRDGVEMYNQDNIQICNAADADEIGVVQFGCAYEPSIPDPSSTGHVYMDDIAINDTLGTRNNSWCGPGAIVALKPTGDGQYYDWARTPDTDLGWECVGEIPPDEETTYVSSVAEDDTDTYLFESLADKGIGDTSLINAVAWNILGKLPAAGESVLYPMYRFRQVTDAELSEVTLDQTYYHYVQHIEDVDPVTSSAWLPTNINNSEYGFRQG